MSKKTQFLTRLSAVLPFMPWVSVVVLAVLSFYFLLICNSDVLFMEQMLSLFNGTSEFYREWYATVPGGLLQWAGCFFTQLFYYPLLGASVLLLMWVASFFLLKKAYDVPAALSPLLMVPFVCLLLSQIDLGYWIYYNYNPGYCFSPTLGIFLASLFVCACRYATAIGNRYAAIAATVLSMLLLFASYRYVGIYAVATSAALCILSLTNRRWISAALYAVVGVITPLLFRSVYDFLTNEELFTAALPKFVSNIINPSLTTPFYVALACLVLFPLLRFLAARVKTAVPSMLLLVIVTAGSVFMLHGSDYTDANYHAELQAYRAIDESRWKDAIDIIEGVDGKLTRQNIMFKHIALFNTHEIGDRMFDTDEEGMVPAPADSLTVNTARTSAPLIYLHHGLTNYAYHWSMETQVNKGFDICNLKVMALCALISGEGQLAAKYLGILSRTMFYKGWAEHYMPLAKNPKLIGKYPELAYIHELNSRLADYCSSDEGLCDNFIVSYFAKHIDRKSKYFMELALAYSVIYKGIKNFWPHYVQYVAMHKGERIPVNYQQAAYMFLNLEPQSAPDLKAYNIQFDKEAVIDRYHAFDDETQRLLGMGMGEEAITRMTKDNFGDTFWWAYYFKTKATCY